jgi:4-aminobutyrate aminotransferase-like enzyme
MARVNVQRSIEMGVLMFSPVGPGGATLKISPPLVISQEAIEDSQAAVADPVEEALQAGGLRGETS